MDDFINDGGPAFPADIESGGGPCLQTGIGTLRMPGMTLRDYFAAKAMLGLLAQRDFNDSEERDEQAYPGNFIAPSNDDYSLILAYDAYKIANAMLMARGKTPEQLENDDIYSALRHD